MTFAVRSITRSATGGDIVHRPEIHEAAEVAIGRGGDCEIRLPDLAVSLRHAILSTAGPGRVSVAAAGAEPFEVDGRFVTRADLSLAENPKLVFGSHVLALSAAETGDTVLVDVSRMETAPEAADAGAEDSIFSVAGAGLAKRPVAWVLAALALVLCLAWPVTAYLIKANRHIHADQQWSSGPLSHAHAFLGRNCQACHVKAFVAVRDEACLACHQKSGSAQAAAVVAANERQWGGPEKVALVSDHADHDLLLRAAPLPKDPLGKIQALFRRQFNHDNNRCASCHLEHLADAPARGAAAAGPARPRLIPVLRTVDGCADCHDRLRERLGSTVLRDTPDWRHHPEFRPLTARTPMAGSPPRLTRVSLVEHPSDYSGLIFSHQEHLSPTSGVARMAAGLKYPGGALACADCHRPTKDGGGFQPVEMIRDCQACHSLAYDTGAGAAPRLLPHGHVDKVVATLQGLRGAGGQAEAPARRAPGFLERLGMLFTGRHATAAPAAGPASPERIRALFAPRGLCAECHIAIAPTDPASLDYRIQRINQTSRYLPWGDFNHAIEAHKQDAAGRPICASCHQAEQSSATNELLLPRIAQCAECHGKTKAKSPTAASADCAECHSFHAPGMATPRPGATAPATPRAAAVATVDTAGRSS